MSAEPSSSQQFPQLEKYELLEEIGHGGMATVYRARDLRLEREVAVKVIHKHLRENPEVRRRFVSEAKAVAKLRHPGIVDVYDVSDEEQVERFLVVELIRGFSLRQMLQDFGVLPPEIAAIIVARLCDAVEHAHASGVIHRDIKPENVLIEPPQQEQEDSEPSSGESEPQRVSSEHSRRRARVKLTDFGIAKVLDAQGVTSTGQILGSPAHMAPEQIEGGAIGPHTDVFALGVLFYECMVGHLPFEGKNPAHVLRQVLEGRFEPPDSERPVVGGRWARIVDGALATDADTRIAAASELGAAIHEELEALGIGDPQGELVAYLADPEGYEPSLAERLVPCLLARGEAARKEGRVPMAAADFNRALALRPDDLSILKRVSSLSSRVVWRERAKRGAVVVLGSLVLGAGAFGVTRWVKASDPGPAAPAAADTGTTPSPSPQKEPTSTAAPTSTETAVASSSPAPASSEAASTTAAAVPRVRRPPPTAPPDPEPEEPTHRRVRFVVNPGGAELEVDGSPLDHWKPHELSPGSHSVRAWMEEDPCCGEVSTSKTVTAPPEDDPEAVQRIPVFLPIEPARFRLKGGPGGATVICRGAMATSSQVGELTLGSGEIEWSGTCRFSDGGGDSRTAGVRLRAGRTTPIPWPGGP